MPQRKDVRRLEFLCMNSICDKFYSVVSSYAAKTNGDSNDSFTKEILLQASIYRFKENFTLEPVKKPVIKEFDEIKDLYLAQVPKRFHEELLMNFIFKAVSELGVFKKYPKSFVWTREIIQEFKHSILCFILFISLCLITPTLETLDFSLLVHIARSWLIHSHYNHHKEVSDWVLYFMDVFSIPIIYNKESLKNLKCLKLPHFVSESIIRSVGVHCEQMEHLILRCSFDCCNVEEEYRNISCMFALCGVLIKGSRIKQLCKGCKQMKILHAPEKFEDEDSSKLISHIFKSMLQLEHLVGIPLFDYYDYVTRTFRRNTFSKLKSIHHGAYGKLMWAEFVYDESLPEIRMETLNCFQEVKGLTLYMPAKYISKILQTFPNIEYLSLFIDDFDLFYTMSFNNLTTLDINVGYQTEWTVLAALTVSCINLIDITLRSFALTKSEEDPYATVEFPKLTTLCLFGQGEIDNDVFLALTHSSPLLTTVSFRLKIDDNGLNPLLLNDSTIVTFAENHPLLETFVYKLDNFFDVKINGKYPLTCEALNALIKYCPNLQFVGAMDSFCIPESKIIEYKFKAQFHNWNLRLE